MEEATLTLEDVISKRINELKKRINELNHPLFPNNAKS